MPKGYIIARVTVHDHLAYAEYAKAAAQVQQKFGARPLVVGGETVELEGQGRQRNVVLEFESLEQAVAYYNSPEYGEARKKRIGIADAEVIAVAGKPGSSGN